MPSRQTLPDSDALGAASHVETRRARLIALGLWVLITAGYLSMVPMMRPDFASVPGIFITVWMVSIGGWCVYRTYGYFRALGRLSGREVAGSVLLPLLALALLRLLLPG